MKWNGPVGSRFLGLVIPNRTIVANYPGESGCFVMILIVLFSMFESQTNSGCVQMPLLRTSVGLRTSLFGTMITMKPSAGTLLVSS